MIDSWFILFVLQCIMLTLNKPLYLLSLNEMMINCLITVKNNELLSLYILSLVVSI